MVAHDDMRVRETDVTEPILFPSLTQESIQYVSILAHLASFTWTLRADF